MNLIPTGDIRPTSDANGVHEPLTLYFEGCPVRFIIRDGLPFDLAPAWVLTDVAKALGFAKPRDAGSSLTEGVDKGSNLIGSLGGPQRTKVLTYTGLTKLLMRSDKETARRFQDWLAAKSSDLTFYGVAFRDQSAAEVGYVTAAQMDAKLASVVTLTDTLATVVGALAGKLDAMAASQAAATESLAELACKINSRPVSYDAKSPKGLLPRLTKQAKARLAADGFTGVSAYLTGVLGEKPARAMVDSLAQRMRLYCETSGCTVLRFLERSRPSNFYPWVHVDAVHKQTLALDANGQGVLFADVIDLASRRGGKGA